jgi:glycosyltransferase involved in cell wall biosynthesis
LNATRHDVLVISHVAVVWGAQTVLLDLAPRLREHGFDLTLASPAGDLPEAWRDFGLPTLPLELPDHRGVRRSDRRIAAASELVREASVVARSTRRIATHARSFDLVQSHSLYAHLETALAGRLARRPVVIDVHDIVAAGPGRMLLRAASRLARVTVANSGATAEMVGGAERPGVLVINPGVDLERFRPEPSDPDVRKVLSAYPDAPLVGVLGRVDPRKGVDTLVEAMGLLAQRGGDACLVVVGSPFVGDDGWMAGLQARADQLLGDRVRFVGPRPDPERVLRSLDVLVNSSHHEPFGRTVLEAQATGIPVVGTDSGGIPEFVADGDTGLLVPPRDPVAMSDAIARALTDDVLRRRLSVRGRAQAVEHFGVDAQAAKVAAAYRRALGEAT